ncbi:MAG: SGNH/GDSL hydrolase family protein [Proteobacteria bacterium]|nr:SGNH/GDSL hydrolase family protein [Pseudomonadota bacterium]
MNVFRSVVAWSLALLALASMPAQAAYYSALVAFGDSLSDNGASLLAKTLDPQGGPTPRASDGAVVVEYVAQALGITLKDYAVGGARSDSGNSDFSTGPLAQSGVQVQIEQFRLDVANNADPLALYFVSGGSNDVLDAILSQDLSDPAVLDAFVGGLVGNLAKAVQDLYSMGARSFVLPLLPNMGLTPEAAGMGLANDLSELSWGINSVLADGYAQLAAMLPDAELLIYDGYATQTAILADPAAYGLVNGTDACKDSPAADCSTYFFWDALHPTTAASNLLAGDILAALPAPEPATLALAAGGLLLVMVRRRRA